MLLDDAAVRQMKTTVGADASIVLICRNPVKRLLSSVNLMNVYNGLEMDDAAAERWLLQMLEDESSWLRAQDRYNAYPQAIERYSMTFGRFVVISYDELVGEPESTAQKLENAIEARIDRDAFTAGLSSMSNELGQSFKFSSTTVDMLATRYRDSQEFLDDYFEAALVR